MIKAKENVNWYTWVCDNIRDPEKASESAWSQLFDAKYFCNTKREFAIAIWAILNTSDLPSEIEDMLDEAFIFEKEEVEK